MTKRPAGTVPLDEAAELTPRARVRLLRALQAVPGSAWIVFFA